MGGHAYDYLNHEMQGDRGPNYSDWLGYSAVQDTTWAMDIHSLDYFAEQSAPDFTMPSPSYVAKPSGLLGSFDRILTGVSRATSR